MTAGKDCHKDLHTAHFTGFGIDNLQLVTSIVDIHLVACHVFHMSYGLDLISVATNGALELRIRITLRMILQILFMKGFDCYALLAETLHVVWNQGFKFLHPLAGFATSAAIVSKQLLKFFL